MSRLQHRSFLVITELHLLPTARGSSSIAALAALPLSSRNKAWKSARDERAHVCMPTALQRRTKGSESIGKTTDGGLAVIVGLGVLYFNPELSTQPREPGCQTTYFIFISLKTSTSEPRNHQNKKIRQQRDGTELNKGAQ